MFTWSYLWGNTVFSKALIPSLLLSSHPRLWCPEVANQKIVRGAPLTCIIGLMTLGTEAQGLKVRVVEWWQLRKGPRSLSARRPPEPIADKV